MKRPDAINILPQVTPNSDYVWDRKLRKLVKKGEESIVSTKDNHYWDPELRRMVKKEEPVPDSGTYWEPVIKQLVTKPEPPKPVVYKREVPYKPITKHASHYIKVEDGSLHKFYNTKSQYLKDMAALEDL